MEADNQNSWNSLRSNLDRITEVPGEPAFNTDAAWNKLSVRLEKKPMHRKPAFFWAAAATLLLIFSAALYTLRQPGESNLVNRSSKSSLPNHNLLPDSELVILDGISTKPSIAPAPLSMQNVKTKAPVRMPRKLTAGKNNIAPVTTVSEPEISVPDSSALNEPVLSAPADVAQKKPIKLKVVHNNELNSVIYKPELSVTNAPTRSGQFRFSRNASDNILQVKISITN